MNMSKDEIIRHQTQEGIKRLCVEILVRVFNDILTKKWYIYYLSKLTKNGDKFTKNKLRKHYDAIEWFMVDRQTNIFLDYLNLEMTSDRFMWKVIQDKMNGNKKFYKILEEV
jgi:hypothetical protein